MRLDRVEQPVNEFVDNFCNDLKKLNAHDFISKEQSNFFKSQKEKLKEDEMIALMDFSENLAFEIQDAAQSYYYAKIQCTIHPICIYHKENGELKQKSIIVIAESLKHDVKAVYLFQKKLVQYVKKSIQGVKKIFFFSDGAPSQYKNKNNFLNLCSFRSDFDIEAEWHFFATSHGKNPCDALGGAFKRNAKLYNMKNATNPINSARALFNWSQLNSKSKIHFIYCDEKEYNDSVEHLNSRLNQKIKPVEGSQSLHSFKPIDKNSIMASTLSTSHAKKKFTLV